MKSNNAFVPIAGMVTLLIGLFVTASVLLGSGNQLAALCKYLLVAGFVCGYLFPKGGFVFWMGLCGYTDLLKRLMIVSGRISYNDLYYVLGMPPVMLGGITLAVLSGAFTGRFQLSSGHWKLFFAGCGLVLVSAAMAAKESGGSLGAIVPAIANDGFYAMLIFLLPVLFADAEDATRLCQRLVWIYVPVALYGVYQQVYGFQDFEIAYLKTGLSLEIKQLVADEVRAFSTLNSPTSFSIVCGALCAISLVLGLTPRPSGRGALLQPVIAGILGLIYVAGLIASASRSAFFVIFVAMAGYFCFRSRTATKLLYAGLVTSFITLVFSAEMLLSNLDALQGQVASATGGGEFAGKMTRVSTFSDRLRGFATLATNPDAYTLFGYGSARGSDPSDPLYSHDIITNNLVTHGLVPVLFVLVVFALGLSKAHGSILRITDRRHRLLAAGLLALAFSFFAVSVVSGGVISIFPVNVFLWLSFGLLILVL
ncbi:MAG: hypothetical protein ACOYMN_05890, partial [Roseimicrobium sp.]